MAKVKIKAVLNVEIPEPKKSLEKQTSTERNDYVRQCAEEAILDALQLAELNPEILKIRLTRTEKGE